MQCSIEETNVVRPLANYHPDLWGDRFFNYTPPDTVIQGQMEQAAVVLKELVRQELLVNDKDPKERLAFLDDVHRLGVAYHFEDEIEDIFQKFYNKFYVDSCYEDDLHYVSLRFRLLRQHGFFVSCDVFENFKCEDKGFKDFLASDVQGLLNLYEASYLGVHGEKTLDEARAFATTHLTSFATQLSSPMAEQVAHALKLPLQRRSIRLESRHQISFYESKLCNNETLLKFAKLDFNLLQILHNTELRDLTRWDKSCIDQFPSYLREMYQVILDTFQEIEQNLALEQRSFGVYHLQQQMNVTCQAYLHEAMWRHENVVPTFDEYMKNAIGSSGYLYVITASFIGMGELATKDAFESVDRTTKAQKASCILARLLNDIASHEFEKKRNHVSSAIDCYMDQFGTSIEEATRGLQAHIEEAWKDTNDEILEPKIVPKPLLLRVINLSRTLYDMYHNAEDGYTTSTFTQEKVAKVLIHPIASS